MKNGAIPLKVIPIVLLMIAVAVANNIVHLYVVTTNATATANSTSTTQTTATKVQDIEIIRELVNRFQIEEIRTEGHCVYIRGYTQISNTTINANIVQCDRTVVITAIAQLPH